MDEASSEVFRMLVREGKVLTFASGKAAPGRAAVDEDADEIVDLAQPEDDGVDARGMLLRYVDTKLQTRLTPAGLQKRLLELYQLAAAKVRSRTEPACRIPTDAVEEVAWLADADGG